MGNARVEEFTIGGVQPADSEPPTDPRRRPSRHAGRSPWLWVAAAVALIASGVVVSPGGQRPPPATAWTAEVPEGRAPEAWVLGDRIIATSAVDVVAFDAATGEALWAVPLDDPACTEAGGEFTCVHGEGEDAAIATITADGQRTDRALPFANVALTVGDALLVAGATPSGAPWVDRYGAGEQERTWRTALEFPLDDERWGRGILSQGVATFFTPMGDPLSFGAILAVDAETGDQRPVVLPTPRGNLVGMNAGVEDDHHRLLPTAGPGLDLAEHPDAIITTTGVLAGPDGELLYDSTGDAILASLGPDILEWVIEPMDPSWEPSSLPEEFPGSLRRVDVSTSDVAWRTPTESILGCPCTVGESTAAFLTSTWSGDDGGFEPVAEAILGFDLDTGRRKWSIPLSAIPDALTAGTDHVYILSGGTLTAFADR
ncbi:hypothetical protein [Ruania halotolerans]|uniref:hypothetical protein n=1 Tax=Ruania halotolerans TaxID=2897773 RepID=UPI001E47353B|nr:hypothetical protein [Ruania halotolerans]UFU05866.1 hypothetical protein LQF10_15745 [Ruania halotolerans]